MKKYLFIFLLVFVNFIGIFVFAGNTWKDETTKIYTKHQYNVIKSNDINDPLRAWTNSAIKWTTWSVWWIAVWTVEHQKDFMHYLSLWINYFLWFLWLLVIILIIKDGIVMITSAWDEWKKKEAFVNLRNYILALIWIWASYLLINLIFYFVNVNTWVV